MEKTDLIRVEVFCTYHDVEISFIDSLDQFGLIEVIVVDEQKYLSPEQLTDVERMMRLHYDLDINMEGIDAISGLLQRVNELQKQLTVVQNRLRLYEEE